MNAFQQLKEKKVLDKDGKVDALGPYGRMKLTGREVATYFRKNKVRDKEIRKAVEVALDLSGADSIARKEIKKFYGDKILKSKEVQHALKFANEETFREQLEEDYKEVIKMYPRDKDWKKLINKHKRDIDKFRNNNKDLPRKVEDDLISWALDNGEISHKGEVEDFIDAILNESQLSEGKNLMPDIQKIVDTKGAKKVGGIMVDMFTASMINQIYNKVNDSNKKKMEKSNISTLVDIAQRMMQKMGDNLGEAANPAQQAAIAISKKEKAGKPGYDKEGKSLKNKKESVMNSYREMWEKGKKYAPQLDEKKEFKQSDIDKVAKLTDRNEHTKSLMHIAKSMGDRKSLKKLELIDKMHDEYGHMPKGLMDMRNEVYDDLKKGMKKYSNGQDMYGAT